MGWPVFLTHYVKKNNQEWPRDRQIYPMFNGFWTARLPSCLFPAFTSFGICHQVQAPSAVPLSHLPSQRPSVQGCVVTASLSFASWIFNLFISLFYMNFPKHLLWSIFWNQLRYEEGERLRKSETDKLIYLARWILNTQRLDLCSQSVYRLLETKHTNWYIIKLLQLKFPNAYSGTKAAGRSRGSIMEPLIWKRTVGIVSGGERAIQITLTQTLSSCGIFIFS